MKHDLLEMALDALKIAVESDLGRLWNWPETARATWMKNAKATIAALEAAKLEAQPVGVLAGWKLVPIEPTKQQQDTGRRAMRDGGLGAVSAAYRAMLSDAPALPVEPVQKSAWQIALDIRTAQGWKTIDKAIPVLYTDEINGQQVYRDDLWLATTEALKTSAPAVEPVRDFWHPGLSPQELRDTASPIPAPAVPEPPAMELPVVSDALEIAAQRFDGTLPFNWCAADGYSNGFEIASELRLMAEENAKAAIAAQGEKK